MRSAAPHTAQNTARAIYCSFNRVSLWPPAIIELLSFSILTFALRPNCLQSVTRVEEENDDTQGNCGLQHPKNKTLMSLTFRSIISYRAKFPHCVISSLRYSINFILLLENREPKNKMYTSL